MRKVFILMLLALNLVCFNHAMALSDIEQSIVLNDEGKPSSDEDKEENPEDDCD